MPQSTNIARRSLHSSAASSCADFGLASLYEIKFEKFTPSEPDDFMKERITAALSAADLSGEPQNFAMGGENDWDWQECSFEASGQRFLRIWATSA